MLRTKSKFRGVAFEAPHELVPDHFRGSCSISHLWPLPISFRLECLPFSRYTPMLFFPFRAFADHIVTFRELFPSILQFDVIYQSLNNRPPLGRSKSPTKKQFKMCTKVELKNVYGSINSNVKILKITLMSKESIPHPCGRFWSQKADYPGQVPAGEHYGTFQLYDLSLPVPPDSHL